MFIVGLTGGIATGKSTVSRIFKDLGCPVVDADEIARDVVKPHQPAWKALVKNFGRDILLPNEEIDREKLGKIVFGDDVKRRVLNKCTHPAIYSSILWALLKYFVKGEKFVVLDLPLLYESGVSLFLMKDVIVVYCDEATQMKRLMERNNLTQSDAELRINAQMSLDEKCKRASYIIDNSSNRKTTENLPTWFEPTMANMSNKRLMLFLSIILWMSNCWAEDGFRICFQETEGSSQCQGPSHTCSGWSSNPAWTQSFRDDTDDRSGGCNYQWKIEAHQNIQPNQQYRLCFQETEGSSQCQGTRSSCTGWSQSPSWTKYFRDDTDLRSGGCRYAWKIESKPASYSISTCRVCFKETEGSSQCQGNRESCSGWSAKENPEWTLPFRDDTDNRGGGCAYYWYLDCQYSKCGAALNCPTDSPC